MALDQRPTYSLSLVEFSSKLDKNHLCVAEMNKKCLIALVPIYFMQNKWLLVFWSMITDTGRFWVLFISTDLFNSSERGTRKRKEEGKRR